jgi:alkanesulfonate monooxygenase SsuD/methylene tetrahydromethanopterin reductase-like flavin-dependent oxidoreductase (luciferase family)
MHYGVVFPIQRPIPIWCGGAAEPALRRAARLADGWMPASRKPEDAGILVEQLDGYLREAGRDRKNFGIDPWISIGGLSQDEWSKRVEGWRALGATHIAVDTMRAGFQSPQEHIDAIRNFRQMLG